jgi:hypothetical protein
MYVQVSTSTPDIICTNNEKISVLVVDI